MILQLPERLKNDIGGSLTTIPMNSVSTEIRSIFHMMTRARKLTCAFELHLARDQPRKMVLERHEVGETESRLRDRAF